MIWEISVALIAVAFAVLVVFLIKTLKAAEKSLDKTTQTLQEVQKTIDELSYEVKNVVRQANDITGDLQHKMEQIDPVLESVKNVGDVLNEVTLAAKQVSTAFIDRIKSPPKPKHPKVSEAAKTQPAVAQTPEEMRAYALPYETPKPATQPPGWMKWVDVAAGIWQKYRS
ncbi:MULTISPECIES: DUF948 domain-containing protein [Paenibacillus]|uniref:DUF948 domain-containing protein n=1 Tax=Paenibacillus vini TaxID=1476024 RepID=A0ABQ4MF36_9BACL|nr:MULTISPECIES: DUF948 domain-containing protein [Paenibacillus]MBQ4901959.1 DUF948 domain-containing protein [Paenibacillus sp. Marseille-P2973]MDN4068125.1 DUF948 domain-containing protein [Paenibacillus vini]GIP54596.1 hypothetical protein J42TS3_36310 [Paenibacillus vini]